jgi:hypothetical protein
VADLPEVFSIASFYHPLPPVSSPLSPGSTRLLDSPPARLG